MVPENRATGLKQGASPTQGFCEIMEFNFVCLFLFKDGQ